MLSYKLYNKWNIKKMRDKKEKEDSLWISQLDFIAGSKHGQDVIKENRTEQQHHVMHITPVRASHVY